jgi:hypothetical protein
VYTHARTLAHTRARMGVPRQDTDIYLARVRWLPCSRALSYQWLSRDQKARPSASTHSMLHMPQGRVLTVP